MLRESRSSLSAVDEAGLPATVETNTYAMNADIGLERATTDSQGSGSNNPHHSAEGATITQPNGPGDRAPGSQQTSPSKPQDSRHGVIILEWSERVLTSQGQRSVTGLIVSHVHTRP